jgi:threonyl-tRNA synthetase
MQKVPYILVVGKQEAADETVAPNERGVDEKRPAITVEAFAIELRDRVKQRR